MIDLLKQFLLDLNSMLGKLFFKSHSGFVACCVDQLRILITPGISVSEWTPRKGRVDLGSFDVTSFPEGNGGFGGSACSHIFDEIPDALKRIIKENRAEIEAYLGKDFLFDKAFAFETRSLPDWAHNYDIYSNVWHMDSHEGMRILKIFVNMDLVTEQDGPLVYLDRKNTVKNFAKLWHRWTFDNLRKGRPKVMEGEDRFCSERGGYLILNTANCFHRASSPVGERKRKLLHITLYPKWLQAKDAGPYLISKVSLNV